MNRRANAIVLIVFLASHPLAKSADDGAEARQADKDPFTVRLVDEEGEPVAGANVGFSVSFSNVNFQETGWEYYIDPRNAHLYKRASQSGIVSDKNGVARFPDGREFLKWFGVVSRHPARKLAAVERITPQSDSDLVTVTMKTECRVSGRLTSKQLDELGKPLRETSVTLYAGDYLAAEYWSREPVFEFHLPPGKYELHAHSGTSATHRIKRSIEISRGRMRLDLGEIDLALRNWRLLEGKPAPELRDVVAWKGRGPLKLAQLRGKVVLLDFWGQWCGSCIAEMPELFKLHDKYHGQGLVIIGVHQDAGAGIDSPDELDKAMAATRKDEWGGRDFPFPIAFVRHKETPLTNDASGHALNQLGADYGIGASGMILIDRQGRVAGEFYAQKAQIERLEKLLAE